MKEIWEATEDAIRVIACVIGVLIFFSPVWFAAWVESDFKAGIKKDCAKKGYMKGVSVVSNFDGTRGAIKYCTGFAISVFTSHGIVEWSEGTFQINKTAKEPS